MVYVHAFKVFLLMTMMSGMEGHRRSLSNAQEVTWISGIGKDCQTVCPNPLVFSTAYGNNPPAYSCQVQQISGVTYPGFQTKTGECIANFNGSPVSATSYDCGCLAPGSQPGLDKPSPDCSTACTKSVDGTSGSACTDGKGFICMALTEMGKTNHFGTAKNGKCEFIGEIPYAIASTTEYSCVCSFAQGSKTAG